MFAERLDGSVLLAGCDKSLPGMLMAAARLDLASVFLYAGSTLPGKLGDRDLTIIDVFEGVGACAAGKITRDELDRDREGRLPGRGLPAAACTPPTRWPARPRRSAWRCPAAPPRRRPTAAATPSRSRSGEAVVNLLDARHHRPADHDQGGVRERDHRRHGARRLDQRRPAPAGDRARGAGRPRPSTTSTGSATAPRTWPTSSRSAGS